MSVGHHIETEDHPIPKSYQEAIESYDAPKWKEAIKVETESLKERGVFGPIVEVPKTHKALGGRWVFDLKKDAKGITTRFKARFVAKGYAQKFGVDYDQTYSPVIDNTTLRWILSQVIVHSWTMHMQDIVTAYLYGDMDAEVYMQVPSGMDNEGKSKTMSRPGMRILKSLYGLKQAGRCWFLKLKNHLERIGFISSESCPCVFIKRENDTSVIILVYVDDLNIIGTSKNVKETCENLRKKFKCRDMGETSFCIGQQIERINGGIFLHQQTYTLRLIKKFNMAAIAHSNETPMVGPMRNKKSNVPLDVRSLNIERDQFRPREEGEEKLGPTIPYLSAIGALRYLADNTRPDISFAVSLLSRFTHDPTKRHWVGVKQTFRYLHGTTDLGLFYSDTSKSSTVVGYADAGYQSDPHACKSQSGYVFTSGGTAFSWRSTKQTLVTTSSNHAEIIALYEATRECLWLRSMMGFISSNTKTSIHEKMPPTIIYEDNAACVYQTQVGYVKTERTKHIDPKYFFAQERNNGEIKIESISSDLNLADLFTKSLPASRHKKLVHGIGMRRLNDITRASTATSHAGWEKPSSSQDFSHRLGLSGKEF